MKVFAMPDWRLVMTLVGGSLMVAGAFAAEPPALDKTPSTVPGIVQYQTPTGEDFAALVLPAPAGPAVQRQLASASGIAHDHVVIVDTSASQTGVYRTRSLSVASAFAAKLPDSDRMMLLAADVATDDLTFGFAKPGSPELEAAFERLQDRVPLGSSNLEAALTTTVKSFKGNRARSVLYIGDGLSTAQLIQSPAMRKLVSNLRAEKITVTSLGIGPRLDLVLLGTLAQHTGGVVRIDEPNLVASRADVGTDAAKLGAELLGIARAPVFYPEEVITKPVVEELQPGTLPPVRFDRETVLLCQGLRGTKLAVKMNGTVSGETRGYSWNLSPEIQSGSTAYVYQAWKMAQASHGVAMPFAGRAMLMRSHHELQAQLNELADAGSIQLQRKNLQQAEQTAQTLQQLDPSNVKARLILSSTSKLRTQTVKMQRVRTVAQAEATPAATAGDDATPAEAAEEKPAATETPATEDAPVAEKPAAEKAATEQPAADATAVETAPAAQDKPAVEVLNSPTENTLDSTDRSNPKNDSLLDELTDRQRVRIEQMTSEVNLAVADATRIANSNFEEAYNLIKRLIDDLDFATEIPESVRQPMRRRLETTLQKLQNENEVALQKAASLRTRQSADEARKKLMVQAERDEERMQQLIERVRALLVRGVKGEASAFEEAEEYARIAVELDPYNYVPNLDVFNAEAFGALDQARRMRALRADKFLAAMYEVERAHVPFPDEPPVLWPSAERWREITIKREKWKSVDLKNYSKQEEKIVAALNKPMKEKFDFIDATLEDVRNKLIEVYEINVIIDKAKLEEETIATDTADINLVISDIMLKKDLKLLLEPKNLTYSIQDEVLKITTKTDGAGKKPIKAVYAGDLATPVNPLFGQAGGQVGGISGGNGGQLGQSGGGFGGGGQGFGGGGGGGFGGGGFGGGGGNFFNVPPPKLMPVQGPGAKPDQLVPEVQPKAVLPKPAKAKAGNNELGSRQGAFGQAFAQVNDKAAGGVLNSETLKNRKKKPLNAR